jgi:hypothetical protein
MCNVLILLFLLLVIFYFISQEKSIKDNFVQVKSDISVNKNAPTIKPIQVTYGYNQIVKSSKSDYDRDDWVTTPHYQNIIPNLINNSQDKYLPGQSNGQFEQYDKSTSKVKIKVDDSTTFDKNPKMIRKGSGHLIRPIELNSSASKNTQKSLPYVTKDFPQEYSEYLEYQGQSDQKI